MSIGKKLGLGALALGVSVAGVFGWAKSAGAARLDHRWDTHRVEIPVPFPLSAEELRTLEPEGTMLAAEEKDKLALERAVARGKHLVESRYGCADCHGKDFGGGTMVDAAPMGKLLGKNLTRGKGSAVANYKTSDWERLVRHGVKPDGTGTAMPAVDFFEMSDRELSDLIAYIGSLPPVDAAVPNPTFGPLGTILLATGKILVPAEMVTDHHAAHAREAPVEAADFGKHLAQTCVGCHGPGFSGGPIPGGDPAWPVALNLTPHAEGLAGWTYETFEAAVRKGVRKDGTPLRPPMSMITSYAQKMEDHELRALWAYLQRVPAKPSGQR
ncbi:MAG: c-type cytochrome [Archangium sp.]|nr:c-type cytochrome [Archangium sp.]